MKASSAADCQLAKSASITTEKPESASPIASASSEVTRPDGIGRFVVRFIVRSMSRSHHMLSAPEAPAPTAMQTSAAKASTGCGTDGAASMPTSAVKITSRITRGFSSST